MVDDFAAAQIQLGDGGHILIAESKIPNVEIFLHPLLVGGLGDDDHTPLSVPAQSHLGSGFAVLLAELGQNRVGENVVFPFGHWSPRLRLDVQGFHVLDSPGLSEEGMQLHLVDHRGDPGIQAQVGQPVRVEVAHADGPDLSSLVQLLHGPPGSVVVVHRLVDQVQVQIVQAQLLHRSLEGSPSALIPGILNPQLGGDEQLFPGDPAFGDSGSHRFLVEISGGGIDKPIPHRKGVAHRLLTDSSFRHLKYPEALQRHLDSV